MMVKEEVVNDGAKLILDFFVGCDKINKKEVNINVADPLYGLPHDSPQAEDIIERLIDLKYYEEIGVGVYKRTAKAYDEKEFKPLAENTTKRLKNEAYSSTEWRIVK